MTRIPQRVKAALVSLSDHREEAVPAKSVPIASPHPLYGVALLKVALELKKKPETEVGTAIQRVLRQMGLPTEDFAEFLRREGGILRMISEQP